MADVKIVNIDGEQWDIKDQNARDKNTEQDIEIENLATKIDVTRRDCGRFYYDANTDRNALQNRIDAMIYCFDNSKSGVATIRYSGGHYYNVIIPAVELELAPIFVEITYDGIINTFRIRNRTDFQLVKSV